MDPLVAKQQRLKESISNALANFKKVGKNNYTTAIIRARRANLDRTWQLFQAGHDELPLLLTEEERAKHPYFKDATIVAVEDAYNSTCDYMSEMMEKLEPSATTSAPSGSPSPHVPSSSTPPAPPVLQPISLPSFDGNYAHWDTFRDRFHTLVCEHKGLSDVSKMHYLTSSLCGAAYDSIRHIPIRVGSFAIAWKELLSRYDNPSRVLSELLDSLLSLPSARAENPSDLHDLRSRVTTTVASLKKLGRDSATLWDDILVHLTAKRLDQGTRKSWALHKGALKDFPSFDDMQSFLLRTANALEDVTGLGRKPPMKQAISRVHLSTLKTSPGTSGTASSSCPLCQSSHFIQACARYMSVSPAERRELVARHKRCFNCLSSRHSVRNCPSKYRCQECNKRHHSTLHTTADSPPERNVSGAAGPPHSDPPSSSSHDDVTALHTSLFTGLRSSRLLATAMISVGTLGGRTASVRALIDPGADSTFISENLAQLIRAKRLRVSTTVTVLGGESACSPRHAAHIIVKPRTCDTPSLQTVAFIVPTLTAYILPRHPDLSAFPHLTNLTWADDDPTSSTNIDVIIGVDLYGDVILDGVRKGRCGEPIAQNSIFGWILSGRWNEDPGVVRQNSVSAQKGSSLPRINAYHCVSAPSLSDQLQRFWELEELPLVQPLSPHDAQCEEHFRTTHSRDPTGRYIVRLPFKTGPPINIGASRNIAVRLALSIERRIGANPDLSRDYVKFMFEYERLGHMRSVSGPLPQLYPLPVYIPHHPVLREDSVTSRLRVVFNGSCRTSNGTTLNEHMHTGPKLQTDLSSIILRWRQFPFVYSADIEKMYRQIKVDSRDLDYQRILWRSDAKHSFSEYQLLTVTYGTACAPYLALRVLRQLTSDEGQAYPLAARVLQANTYVDDVLFGADDMESIQTIKNQLISLLAKGGFSLRKWASNSARLLSEITATNHGLADNKILAQDEHLKVLGLSWNPTLDEFRFYVSPSTPDPVTKRLVLSFISRLFDPLGWITPVIIKAKILMQHLWKAKIQWDDRLPAPLEHEWTSIASQLPQLNSLAVPRWTQLSASSRAVELHGFADASNAAYAAAVYIRVSLSSGPIVTRLLAGKSKVAPLKPVSVPRLELCAAVLLSRLITYVADTLELRTAPIFCWTDSTVVLHWVYQHSSRWKTFVANRVALIQSLLPSASWRHVSSAHNPADCASKGLYASELLFHALWWNGPTWLTLSTHDWPTDTFTPTLADPPEQKITSLHTATDAPQWDLADRYSSWLKLLRVTAYIQRFVNLLMKRTVCSGPSRSSLSADEIHSAKIYWIQRLQSELFPIEIRSLAQNKPLPNKNRLLALAPFLDSNQIIRVGGRLRHAPLSFHQRHPILLAPHPTVKLIVSHAHLRALHAGPQLTLSVLRQEFWLLRARSIVRRVISQCVLCTRERAAVPSQLMGDLPRVRVTPGSRSFQHCGVDYAGPVRIRAATGRGIPARKAYISLFVCLVTRAIHLELVPDYSTEAFIRAFARFCARRGLPQAMYSDNGSNFVGADREMTKSYRAAVRDPNFQNSTASDGISWHFIPPSAPHFGGMWEAGVRSLKHHLSRTLGDRTVTFEECYTFLCQIEACLNSRPLAPLSDSFDNYECLTPGHFTIGSAINAHPEPSVLDLKENRLSRWQLVRQMSERFWRLWQNDYLNTLQQRSKWRQLQPDVCVGRLVVLRNPSLPPGKWELGRIVRCHPGPDGKTRVVTVKTAQAEYKRPIVKLCMLPVWDRDSPDK